MSRDPLTAERTLMTVVNGIEYKLNVLRDRIENTVFFKEYLQILNSEEPLAGGVFRRRDRDTHQQREAQERTSPPRPPALCLLLRQRSPATRLKPESNANAAGENCSKNFSFTRLRPAFERKRLLL